MTTMHVHEDEGRETIGTEMEKIEVARKGFSARCHAARLQMGVNPNYTAGLAR